MSEILETNMEQIQSPEVEHNNMGRFARVAAALALTAGIALGPADIASSHEQDAPVEQEGGVLIPPAHACPDPITARWIACEHTFHGDPPHSQWRNGQGTPGHTWRAYRREARLLRRYLENVS